MTVDKHNPTQPIACGRRYMCHSIGMTLPDLARLAERLKLRDALNLDGGGSTTMVVKGKIVNNPSDPTGPRLVSDAVLVTLR
jgi:exopolysaccharide biosynthesis protein